MVSYSKVSSGLHALNEIYSNLYCIVSRFSYWLRFCMTQRECSRHVFFNYAWKSYAMMPADGVTTIHLLYLSTKNNMPRTTQSLTVSEILILSCQTIEFCMLRKSLNLKVFPITKISKRRKNKNPQYPQQQLNVIPNSLLIIHIFNYHYVF